MPKVQSRFREFLSDRKNLQFGRPVLDVSKVLEIQYYRLSVSRSTSGVYGPSGPRLSLCV